MNYLHKLKNFFQEAKYWKKQIKQGLDESQQLALIKTGRHGLILRAIKAQPFADAAVLEIAGLPLDVPLLDCGNYRVSAWFSTILSQVYYQHGFSYRVRRELMRMYREKGGLTTFAAYAQEELNRFDFPLSEEFSLYEKVLATEDAALINFFYRRRDYEKAYAALRAKLRENRELCPSAATNRNLCYEWFTGETDEIRQLTLEQIRTAILAFTSDDCLGRRIVGMREENLNVIFESFQAQSVRMLCEVDERMRFEFERLS